MSNATGLLTLDWDTPVTDDEREALFQKIVGAIRRWRLELPVTLFLESTAPLSNIAAQGMIVGSPLLAMVMPRGLSDVQQVSKLLQEPRNVRLLIDRIHEEEPNAVRG
jgi:hypothetical protein